MAQIIYPDARKAVRQIERRDARGAEQYRAELKYRHFRPRVALNMSNVDTILEGKPSRWCCEDAFLTLGKAHTVTCSDA